MNALELEGPISSLSAAESEKPARCSTPAGTDGIGICTLRGRANQ
jgi:hypothetical protein